MYIYSTIYYYLHTWHNLSRQPNVNELLPHCKLMLDVCFSYMLWQEYSGPVLLHYLCEVESTVAREFVHAFDVYCVTHTESLSLQLQSGKKSYHFVIDYIVHQSLVCHHNMHMFIHSSVKYYSSLLSAVINIWIWNSPIWRAALTDDLVTYSKSSSA